MKQNTYEMLVCRNHRVFDLDGAHVNSRRDFRWPERADVTVATLQNMNEYWLKAADR